MERQRVSFSVDGASAVDARIPPADMPSALVPWAQIFYKGDAVTLSHHRFRQTPSVRTPPPHKVAASPQYDTRQFDSGPWVS